MTPNLEAASGSNAAEGTAEHSRQVRKAALASMVGTTIEWYDYFLYGTAAALVFPGVFFPNSSGYVGQLESFATLFLGFAARPIGAMIFGHYGDRIGRKFTLIVTLLMMGLSTTLIGLLPGADSWGKLAPTVLILLRLTQGVAVGGEWGGSVLLSMEWGDQKRRGLMASWPQQGVATGLILGTSFLYFMSSVTTDAQFNSWGWRIPFLFSMVLVAVGLYIRLQILETPIFAQAIREKTIVKTPVLQVIREHPRAILLAALARMSEQAPFYIVTTFVLTYVTDDNHGYTKSFVLAGTLIAAGIEFGLVPYFGHLSDTVGRQRLYMLGAAITGVWGFVYFTMLDSGIGWLAFAALCLALIPHAMQYGPQASMIAESFPTELRYGGAGLGYQLASLIAGGPAPLIAVFLIHQFGSGYAVAFYMLATSLITLAAVTAMRDHSRSDISDAATYARS